MVLNSYKYFDRRERIHLLVDSDFIKDSDFDIKLIINAISLTSFHTFVKTIAGKGDWCEELCCCYFEKIDNVEFYSFETFEDNNFRLTYNEFLHYVKLAIIRYFLGWKYDEDKKKLEEIMVNTSFSSVLNEIDESYSTGLPLMYCDY